MDMAWTCFHAPHMHQTSQSRALLVLMSLFPEVQKRLPLRLRCITGVAVADHACFLPSAPLPPSSAVALLSRLPLVEHASISALLPFAPVSPVCSLATVATSATGGGAAQ